MNQILPILSGVWRPFLEIGILALGIYYAYKFLKGTRGQAVVTGFVAVLLVLTLTVRLLRLDVLNSLLNQIFPFLALAIAVHLERRTDNCLAARPATHQKARARRTPLCFCHGFCPQSKHQSHCTPRVRKRIGAQPCQLALSR